MIPAKREMALIGSAIGWGSGRLAGEAGPQALQAFGLGRWAALLEAQPKLAQHRLGQQLEALPWVAAHARNLADAVERVVNAGQLPVTLGGDHSTAIGHYAGLSRALAAPERLGIIWIDAHADCNRPETSPSMACHGMALAAVLGEGFPELTQLGQGARVLPQNVCLIGTRSVDPGEQRFLEQRCIRVFAMDEVQRRGLAAVLAEALAIATQDTAGFGLSLDLDAVDPEDAPGVAFREPNGLRAAELLGSVAGLLGHAQLLGLEISEYAPEFDQDGKTARLVQALLARLA